MKPSIASATTAALSLAEVMALPGRAPRVLVNHVGYDAGGSKKLIVQAAEDSDAAGATRS
jgi:hypothetical protein